MDYLKLIQFLIQLTSLYLSAQGTASNCEEIRRSMLLR